MEKALFVFLLILSIDFYATKLEVMTEIDSKYEKDEYLELFQIPNSLISSPKKLEDKNKSKKSLRFLKFIPNFLSKNKKVENNILFSFNKSSFIDRLIYKKNDIEISEQCLRIGEINKLKFFFKQNLDSSFSSVEDFKVVKTEKKIIFIFPKKLECSQLKIEISESSTCPNENGEKVGQNDFLILSPETKNINENILNAYDKNDYRRLTLSKEFNNEEIIMNLEKESNELEISDNAKNYIQRMKAVFTGSLTYDPKREFSTSLNLDVNPLYQRGDIATYAQKTLKMFWAGTNRQPTGIYGRANETITITLKRGNKNDPLPSIVCSQYLGKSYFLGEDHTLKEGTQTIKVDDFKIDDGFNLDRFYTFPGGPLYLINPYTKDMQSQNLSVYIEGGTLFPVYRLGYDQNKYKDSLLETINLNKKDKTKYFDITELIGHHVIFTFKASLAYENYVNTKYRPESNVMYWDLYLGSLFRYDGIQFSPDDPYYDDKNNYLNIHIRFSQPIGESYAFIEHVGIFYDHWLKTAAHFSQDEVGWGYPHEIGHMMEIDDRTIGETTNNMISKFSETHLQKVNKWGEDFVENNVKYLTLDDVDDILRGCKSSNKAECKGYFMNVNDYNFFIFWNLESIYHGYWGKVDNMYRYNCTTETSKLTNEERFAYFSSVALGIDLGYYFSRWGLTFNRGGRIFSETKASADYKRMMQSAKTKGFIDSKAPKKKYWYLDLKEYPFITQKGVGCFEDKSEFNIQITKVTNPKENQYVLTLASVKCPGFLGFEVYENDKIIGFTFNNTFTDYTTYKSGYKPKYKVVGYDRLLDTSNPSPYKSL